MWSVTSATFSAGRVVFAGLARIATGGKAGAGFDKPSPVAGVTSVTPAGRIPGSVERWYGRRPRGATTPLDAGMASVAPT